MDMQTPLQKAVEIAGGQAALARKCKEILPGSKLAQAHVWHWLNRGKEVPIQYVAAIERVTDGQVTRHDLRPDIFGTAPAIA